MSPRENGRGLFETLRVYECSSFEVEVLHRSPPEQNTWSWTAEARDTFWACSAHVYLA